VNCPTSRWADVPGGTNAKPPDGGLSILSRHESIDSTRLTRFAAKTA
jgi:hypothetical protein